MSQVISSNIRSTVDIFEMLNRRKHSAQYQPNSIAGIHRRLEGLEARKVDMDQNSLVPVPAVIGIIPLGVVVQFEIKRRDGAGGA